ncbi:MAG: DUF4139 domain-containing protein, partial [Polyangiaceae bacterium]|nr:DUF4139 domain-containing protein [Polyangiaceae bacterium]
TAAPPPPAPARPSAPLPASMSLAPQQAPARSGGGGMKKKARAMLADEEVGDRPAGGALEAPQAIEPADAWLDFDALRLAGAEERGRRGRLARGLGEGEGRGRREAERAGAAIERLPPPPRAVDPRASRGHFDHLYTASAAADVPSSGRPHRVAVASAEGPATARFVTVPREVAEVYREAEVKNPFDAPLLAGPVDVFVDGALAAQPSISYVDRGGVFRAGLGVEDRLRVARNARVEESSAGLLGGGLAVEHEVTIDISSSLGQPAAVEVIDRIPVTDDKDLEIKLVASQPKAQPYTQAELGAPVRKGLRWSIDVPAGGKAAVSFTYRLNLSARNEVVGGNRRE